MSAHAYSPIPDTFTPFENLPLYVLHALALGYIDTLPRMQRSGERAELDDALRHVTVFQYHQTFIDFLRKRGVSDR